MQVLAEINADQFLTITETAGARISGVAFRDLNANCLRDAGEPAVAGSSFRVSPANLLVTTDAQGRYELRLPAGAYQLAFTGSPCWAQPCAATLNVPATPNAAVNRDLPLTATGAGYDLGVSHGETAWRRGFANQAVLVVENGGAQDAYGVTLTATYPAAVRLTRSSQPVARTGNVYSWTLDTLRAGSRTAILLTDSVTLAAHVGELLPFTAEATAPGTDLNPANNRTAATVEVVGAIDPNDLTVSPRGEGAEGFIGRCQPLTYTVRFQNVGTAPATRVVIDNSLPADLDPTTLRVLGASHSASHTLDANGRLVVTFPHLNLPDSTHDEAGSHGWFRYTIQPRPDAPGGTPLRNDAAITFDYEDPLRTNPVLNTIRFSPDGRRFKLLVSPNPATSHAQLLIDPAYFRFKAVPGIVSVTVATLTGQRVLIRAGQGAPTETLDLTNLPAGLYLVEVTDAAGHHHAERLVVAPH